MLMAELRSDDIDLHEGFTRMSPEQFDELLDLVRDDNEVMSMANAGVYRNLTNAI